MIDKVKIQKILIDSLGDFEYLYDFISHVKEYYPNISDDEIKKITLTIIKILLKKEIITINNEFDESRWDLTIEESIKKINKMWFKGASYFDFIHMVFFKMQDWFYQRLIKEGYNFKDNWVEFVDNNLWLKNFLKIDDKDLKDLINNKFDD